MEVPYVDLASQWRELREEALEKIDEVLCSGNYLHDNSVAEFEDKIARFLGSNYCISLNSGTDALVMALYSLGIGPGDEVITVANSFIASVSAIVHVGAKPVFVDVNDDHLINVELIQGAVTSRTKAIMAVHLEGKTCEMDFLVGIARERNLFLIEDSAQAFGSKYLEKYAGTFGDIGCFSLHPLKNFNALGDAGFIVTNNHEIAVKIRMASNHGQLERNRSDFFGQVSRMDSIQAAVLLLKLGRIESVFQRRARNARQYSNIFKNSSRVTIPLVSENSTHTYHLYVVEVENRDLIMQQLQKDGIQTKIHYPTLIPDQTAYKSRFADIPEIPLTRFQSQRILSLPIHQNLSEDQIDYVGERLLFHIGKITGEKS
jgi:dTDP-4-amino-4,6-dideoxygalactose transaminase